jgi:hypothetical protein
MPPSANGGQPESDTAAATAGGGADQTQPARKRRRRRRRRKPAGDGAVSSPNGTVESAEAADSGGSGEPEPREVATRSAASGD